MLTSRVLSRLARSTQSRIPSTSTSTSCITIIRPISQQVRSLSTTSTTSTTPSTTSSTSLASGPTEGAMSIAQRDPEVAESLKEMMSQPREAMEYDVVIVGAGPAGLSAAIRLKQLASQGGTDISVCVVEKGAEVGAHILSGNVFEPRALNELIPEWKEKGAPLLTPVTTDKFQYLTSTRAISLPAPPPMHNKGNYIISLGALCKWLGKQAEELGVEIYPGFSAAEILYDEQGAVTGIATADVGIGKDGKPKDSFARGMELRAKQTLFAEGVRGSLSELVQKKYNLRQGIEPQTYGIGLKEVWEIPASQHQQGLVIHTLGYPVGLNTWGGTFMYHMTGNKVHLGMVVGLDYKNPYLSPYNEFQRWKHHPEVAKYLKGGTCLSYGARAINEGGYQAIPKLTFPGGALLGCSAGFLNVPKIKGSHTAMKSGMVAAEAIYKQVVADGGLQQGQEIKEYEKSLKSSWVYKELHAVRNIHPGFSRGPAFFFLNSALETYITKGKVPWTLHGTGKQDWEMTEPASKHQPIEYPKPDGILSFDLLNNLQRSGTNHNHDQPAHLRVKPELSSIPIDVSYKTYAAPETRFCPARVYEVLTDDNGSNPRLQINAQNCVHCKTCDIKTPKNYIKWTVPEGGGGPAYENM